MIVMCTQRKCGVQNSHCNAFWIFIALYAMLTICLTLFELLRDFSVIKIHKIFSLPQVGGWQGSYPVADVSLPCVNVLSAYIINKWRFIILLRMVITMSQLLLDWLSWSTIGRWLKRVCLRASVILSSILSLYLAWILNKESCLKFHVDISEKWSASLSVSLAALSKMCFLSESSKCFGWFCMVNRCWLWMTSLRRDKSSAERSLGNMNSPNLWIRLWIGFLTVFIFHFYTKFADGDLKLNLNWKGKTYSYITNMYCISA